MTCSPQLKPGASRFSDAANATPPRRACPARSMFFAALWSRCRLVPHAGQECQRTDKPFETSAPQPLQVCEVNAGLTATTLRPAHAALCVRMMRNAPHPASLNALRQMVILHHVGGLQRFVIDRIVGLNERQGCLVVKVTALATDLLMRFRQQCDGLAAAVTPLFASRYPSLRRFQCALGFAIPTGVEDTRPV